MSLEAVVNIVKFIVDWVEKNKDVQDKVAGMIIYIRSIQTALASFKPKDGAQPKALTEILYVIKQVMDDIKVLLDQVNQGKKKWLFSPDSYYAKLSRKEHELGALIPVLGLAFNVDQYHKSEDIQKMLAPAAGAATPSSTVHASIAAATSQFTFVPNEAYLKKQAEAAAAANAAKSPDSKSAPALPPKLTFSSVPLADALLTGDGKDFWKENFGYALTITTDLFVEKVEGKFGKFDGPSKQAFIFAVDHNKDNQITIYEFAKFALPTFTEAVKASKVVPKVVHTPAPTTPVTPNAADVKSPNSAAAAADAKPPNVLWCDPNFNEASNRAVVTTAAASGSVVMCVPSAKDGIEFLKQEKNSDLLFDDNFRIISSNAIYTDGDKKLSPQEVLEAKMSAAEDIIRFVRQKRSLVPVLIYCDFTFPQAEKIAKLYSVVQATRKRQDVIAYAKLAPTPWIKELQEKADA